MPEAAGCLHCVWASWLSTSSARGTGHCNWSAELAVDLQRKVGLPLSVNNPAIKELVNTGRTKIEGGPIRMSQPYADCPAFLPSKHWRPGAAQ